MLSLEKAAWSFRILQGDSPEPPACRIVTAASSDIFHLPFSPLSDRYRALKGVKGRDGGRGGVLHGFNPLACSVELTWSAVCAILAPPFTPAVHLS